MILKQYIIKNSGELLSYIEKLDSKDVVLKDYFYNSQNSIFSGSNFYTEKQVARILNLTDSEYHSLVESYFNDESKPSKTNDDSQKRINEIDNLIKKSRDYEDALKKIKEVEAELEKIDKDLQSTNEVNRRLNDASQEFKSFEHLSKYNLQKIHDDLVGINSQVEKLEEDLLNKKVVDIRRAKTRYQFDQGRIGLAFGLLIGMGVFGAIFWFVQAPLWIALTIWGIGIIVSFFLAFFSRYEVEVADNQNLYDSYNYQDLEDLLHSLRSQRGGILKLLNLRNTNEFFLMKAKYSSIKKSLEYLQKQKEELKNIINEEELNARKQELINQKVDLDILLANPSVQLQPNQYNSYYAELDTLKKNHSSNKNSNLSKEAIITKLKDIRQELLGKLPSYSEILKTNFSKNFSQIKDYINQMTKTYGITSFTISENLAEWDNLSTLEKFLVQFALANQIYSTNFVYVLEEVSSWKSEEINIIHKIIVDKNLDESNEMILLDEHKVL